jgi:hypothetical protein
MIISAATADVESILVTKRIIFEKIISDMDLIRSQHTAIFYAKTKY